MKSVFILLLMAAMLTMPAVAAETQAMVLASQGKASVTGTGGTEPLRTGMVLKAGAKVKLEGGAQATLIVMPKGERFQVAGPATLALSSEGLKAEAGEVKSSSGPSVALVPTGKNMRHMGGTALRAEAEEVETPYQGISIANLPGDKPGLRVSFLAPTNDKVTAEVSEHYALRGWLKTATGQIKPVKDADDFDPHSTAIIGQASGTGTPEGSMFRYTLDIPLTAPATTDSLRVCLSTTSKDTLVTRSRVLTRQDEAQLSQSASSCREWAAKDPSSPEPWVLLMALYDDYDRVPEALAAGRKALTLAPKDMGIKLAVSRLSLEAGQPKQARDLFQDIVKENGLSSK